MIRTDIPSSSLPKLFLPISDRHAPGVAQSVGATPPEIHREWRTISRSPYFTEPTSPGRSQRLLNSGPGIPNEDRSPCRIFLDRVRKTAVPLNGTTGFGVEFVRLPIRIVTRACVAGLVAILGGL